MGFLHDEHMTNLFFSLSYYGEGDVINYGMGCSVITQSVIRVSIRQILGRGQDVMRSYYPNILIH